MAEYLSLGPIDAQTAMWMRDAAHPRDAARTSGTWTTPSTFPIAGATHSGRTSARRYGDRAIASLVRSAANPRFDLVGLTRQLGTDPDTLTEDWHRAIRASAQAVAANEPPLVSDVHLAVGKATGSGRFNIGPRLSPDGQLVAFFSERDRFSIDLFLADAESGRIERRLVHSATDPHFDSLEFLNSAGAWMPNGRTLAITAVRSGKPVLVLIDAANGRILREVPLAGLDDAINPAVSPDGRTVAFSGNAGGLLDLYTVSLETGHLERLTHDPYADLEPTYTPDGRSLVFTSERDSTSLTTLEPGPLRLARLDLTTHEVRPIPGFLRGKHLSPQVSADGRTLVFIAEPDGISNLYRMPIDGGPILRLTAFPTGVAGITASSPALSVASDTGRLAFSVFEDDGQVVYTLDPADMVTLVPPETSESAAVLPGRTAASGDVARLLGDYDRGLPAPAAASSSEPYRQDLSLDLITQPTVSAGVDQFGGFVSGSISAFFSDMLGDRALVVGAEVAGKLADLGGQLVYVQRKHRWNWAVSVEQTPYRVGYWSLARDADTVTLSETIDRQTTRGVSAITAYPFNTATRVEFTGGLESLSFTREVRVRDYAADTGRLIAQHDEHSTLARPLNLAEASVAIVHDTSFFGATSPIYGRRYRLELDRSEGSLSYSGVLVDWRRYWMPKSPITVAVRGLHYGRYGPDAEDPILIGLYLGYPDLVRGYGIGSFSSGECADTTVGRCGVFENLIGSRLLVANVEVRAPLVGLFRGDLQYGRVPVEVGAFFDSGVAWTQETRPAFAGGTRQLVRSVGGLANINAFGLFVVQISAAHPLDRPSRSWQWQIGIRQGF